MNLENLLQNAIDASLDAGHEILKVYHSEFAVEHKEDKSPLTLADKKSHEAIIKYLESTNIPILSEEGKSIDFEERKNWEYFWLIDPLDGTKEFIKRNGEFTVNIALIRNQEPILGVIYVPVSKDLYYAAEGIGAYKKSEFLETEDVDDLIQSSDLIPLDDEDRKYTMVGSRSHMSEETEQYMNDLKEEKGEVEVISKGSSLKLCMVAEGKADVYPRYAPTMEWDTGAGHAICKIAGFNVTQYNSEEELVYNKENLLNPWFLVS